MSGEVRVHPDPEAVARGAAEEVCRLAAERDGGVFTVALAGGSTPRRLYQLLASDAGFRARVPWTETHVFWGDERHVPPEHSESNYRMAREALLDCAPLPPENVHRIHGEEPDARTAAAAYEEELREFFSAHGLLLAGRPRFHLVLLGLGADGHTASLFPGTDALREEERWVAAPWVEKLAARRITLTLPVINRAREVVFLVTGEEKAGTLYSVVEGFEAEHLPARRVRPLQGRLLWLADRSAARRLCGGGSMPVPRGEGA